MQNNVARFHLATQHFVEPWCVRVFLAIQHCSPLCARFDKVWCREMKSDFDDQVLFLRRQKDAIRTIRNIDQIAKITEI